jgi:hypothetical protein
MVGKKIFIAMAAGYWPGCNWLGAEGAIFGAPSVGVVERLVSPQGSKEVQRAQNGSLRQRPVSDEWCVVEGSRSVAEGCC